MLVIRIQSSASGIRMNRYSPVGDQNPSLAQVVLRRARSTATPTPPQLSHCGIICVRLSPTETAKTVAAMGNAPSMSSTHERLKSARTPVASPSVAMECATPR